MGAISFTLDLDLVRELHRILRFDRFVETGTFQGNTLALVRSLIPECYSVELSPEYHAAAAKRFAGAADINLALGDSPAWLAQHREVFSKGSTLYWLDAHWCAATGTAGEKSQCPLLDELAAIGVLSPQSAILIDDARLFCSPPPKPHEISNWPTLDQIIHRLRTLSEEHFLVCHNDVLLFLPAIIGRSLDPFFQEKTSDLLTLADKARQYDELLAQAKLKDREIASLKDIANTREQESQAKEQVINSLKALSDQREKEINERDIALLQATNEANHLRALYHKAQAALRKPPPWWQNQIIQWQAKLAEETRYPLGKLRQYEPRPLKLEKFPRRRALKNWPRICVITPSFQQAHFLERTMHSVLEQRYPNLAYGVQDGGSTDGSVEIITRHIDRLAHAESTPDKGQTDAIQRGFCKLYPEGDHIMAWLNSDDMLMPGALHFVGEYFAKNPEVDVVYGHRVIIDENDHEIGRWFLPAHGPETLPWFDMVPQETLFWRGRCFTGIGGMDPNFHFAMDWDFLLRLEHAGFTIRRLPYFLGCFRVHSEQKTSAKIATIGEQEMKRLRFRTHQRTVSEKEILSQLNQEIRRSAWVAWLHQRGIRA